MVIVAAVDRADHAEAVVREAASLAEQFDTSLKVVHVLDEQAFLGLEQASVSETGRPIEMDEIRERAAEIASEAAAGVTVDFDAVGLVGNVASQIIRFADSNDARYIVVGGRRQTPVGKVLFGSTAQKVLLGANQPVLMAYEGDESPVE